MPAGASVVDHLSDDPWGDVRRFRKYVYDPIETGAPQADGLTATYRLCVSSGELPLLRHVVQALGEGFAGGVPWVSLSKEERGRLKAVADRLEIAR
jgi:hypothetical protein